MADRGNFNDLFGPNKDYPYFEKYEKFPFKPKSNKFEIVNAAWCADASLLVYVRESAFVLEKLKNANLEAKCEGFETPGVQYFVAHNSEFVIVSFRGTEVKEQEDLLADAKWFPIPSGQGGEVHGGFKNALDSVWGKLETQLQELKGNGRTVWVTGHSLGAALATLAADRWGGTKGLYTFGCPRVGDQDFKNDFHVHAYRFVHQNDIVTRVPPPGLFQHVGNVYCIDSQDEINDNPNTCDRLQDRFQSRLSHLGETLNHWRHGHWDTVALDDLADHSPTQYAEKIWKNLSP